MGGQILGGGAIILVVAVLWLAYLMPSWQARLRDSAYERNAVRLNQALRVLAETTETPDEVRLELSRREAVRQQRLVRRMQAEDEKLRAEGDRIELERKKREIESERIARSIAVEEERRRLALLRADPRAVQARARRRMRLVATTTVLAGLGVAGVGGWQLAASGAWAMLALGCAIALVGLATLRRMASVAARGRRLEPAAVEPRPARERVESELLDPADRGWTPRRLPAPLTATAGSRAADEVAAAAAQEGLRRAVREQPARAELEAEQPAPLEMASARSAQDAEIERHVRALLARRAAG